MRSGKLLEVNGKFGIVDFKNRFLVPADFDEIRCDLYTIELKFAAPARIGDKWALIRTDGSGAAITDFIYDDMPVPLDIIVAAKKGDKWGFLSQKGVELTPFEFDVMHELNDKNIFENAIAIFIKDGKFGIADGQGIISKPVFDRILSCEIPEYVKVEMNGVEGYVNMDGEFTTEFHETNVMAIYYD